MDGIIGDTWSGVFGLQNRREGREGKGYIQDSHWRSETFLFLLCYLFFFFC